MTTDTIKAEALATITAQVRAEIAANDRRLWVTIARIHTVAALIPATLFALNQAGVIR